jgi:hypothetical protein
VREIDARRYEKGGRARCVGIRTHARPRRCLVFSWQITAPRISRNKKTRRETGVLAVLFQCDLFTQRGVNYAMERAIDVAFHRLI